MISRARGFTIFELMLVLTILGIGASLAMPEFTRMVAQNRVRSTAFELYATIVKARSEAIARNGTATLAAASGGWASGWIVTAGSPAVTVDSKAGPGGITVTGPGTSVIFDYSGRASAAATFNIASVSYPSMVRCVALDISGRPFIKAASC